MSIKSSHIILPQNPFWKVFKRFGRDELISLIFNVAGTIYIANIVKNHPEFSFGFKTFLIAIGGPIIEKIGFYPYHLYDGIVAFKRGHGTLKLCLRNAIKGGSVSMIEDIIVHDPVYFGLMWGGLFIYTGTPEWMLAVLSFLLAVGIVSVIEVGVIELWYKKFKRSLRGLFHNEKYYESRFRVATNIDPKDFIDKMTKKFNLSSYKEYNYTDKYLKSKLINFNEREGKVRQRFINDNACNSHIFQITYTKAGEIPQNVLTQYRFFVNEKEKFTSDLNNNSIENFTKYCDMGVYSVLDFHRYSSRKINGLYAAIDEVKKDGEHYSVIELKVFDDLELIQEAMKFVMDEFNVIQTTLGKVDI